MSAQAEGIYTSHSTSVGRDVERRSFADLLVPALSTKRKYQEQFAQPAAVTENLVVPETARFTAPATSASPAPSPKGYEALRKAGEDLLRSRDFGGFSEIAETAAVSNSLTTKEFNALMSHWAEVKKGLSA